MALILDIYSYPIMIVDCLSRFKAYVNLYKHFGTVLAFLEKNSLNTLEEGRYPLLGEDVFVSISHYKTQADKDFEAHKRYIDIQMVLEGSEYIEWCPLSKTQPKTIYDNDKDIIFLSGIGQKFEVSKDLFFIFFPEDAHKPGLPIHAPEHVKKAVFKIKG